MPVTIDADLDPPNDSIDAVASFATTGAGMTGMTIRASFYNTATETPFVETATWAATGATSGSAVGTGWSVSVDGDTFSATWTFAIDGGAGLGQLTEVYFDGSPGGVMFDRTATPGTEGSANGWDFSVFSGDIEVSVLYAKAVGLGGATPVGDLFRQMTLTFGENEFGLTGPSATWTFRQDTDTQLDLPLQSWTLTRISDL